jgi:hypothetical protein
MDMLRCFLTDKTDNRPLFENLAVRQSPVWEMAHSAPVFFLDFKNLQRDYYRSDIFHMIDIYLEGYVNNTRCPASMRRTYEAWSQKEGNDASGIGLLTMIVHAVTGKKVYILIDEYDKLLMDTALTGKYKEIRDYLTALFSAGLKGNPCLEKALLTGVTRISHEGMFSGLNNAKAYDVFSDVVYSEDYGLTDTEIRELSETAGFGREEAKDWYNGIRIGGKAIYNTFGVMSMIKKREFDCYWGNSGMLDTIIALLNNKRYRTLLNLLTRDHVETVELENRISPEKLCSGCPDKIFYSLLVQAGYLSLEKMEKMTGNVAMPNVELREVWRRFLLSDFEEKIENPSGLLAQIDSPEILAQEWEDFLTNVLVRLSYHDLPMLKEADGRRKTPEINYHLLLFGILFMCDESFKYKRLTSNRESGDGRYDICMEMEDRVVVFEVKSATEEEDLEAIALEALAQISEQRYGADTGLPVQGIGMAFRKKQCRVRAAK